MTLESERGPPKEEQWPSVTHYTCRRFQCAQHKKGSATLAAPLDTTGARLTNAITFYASEQLLLGYNGSIPQISHLFTGDVTELVVQQVLIKSRTPLGLSAIACVLRLNMAVPKRTVPRCHLKVDVSTPSASLHFCRASFSPQSLHSQPEFFIFLVHDAMMQSPMHYNSIVAKEEMAKELGVDGYPLTYPCRIMFSSSKPQNLPWCDCNDGGCGGIHIFID